MNFEDFWKKIQSTEGEIELVTLTRKKPFSFCYNHSRNTIDITPGTKDPRASRKKDLKEIWDKAITVTNPFTPVNYHDMTFNSSYIVSIMKYIINDENLE